MRIREPTEHVFLDKSNEDPREDLNFLKIVATLIWNALLQKVCPPSMITIFNVGTVNSKVILYSLLL